MQSSIKNFIVASLSLAACIPIISFGATIPKVNKYNVTLRALAPEPSAAQFSISAEDQVKVSKPSYGYHTQLNLLDPTAIYSIPAYINASKLPKISKWMNFKLINNQPVYAVPQALRTAKNAKLSYVPAHWLNVKSTDGKYIIEPINYAFLVYAKNTNDATTKLLSAIKKAHYKKETRQGFYSAYIAGNLFGQLRVAGKPSVFGNGHWSRQRDHFRVFGPLKTVGKKPAYLYIAAISEESGYISELASKTIPEVRKYYKKKGRSFMLHNLPGHFYVSFSHARNNLAVKLIQSGYPTYFLNAGNVVNTSTESTEDHDGKVFITEIK